MLYNKSNKVCKEQTKQKMLGKNRKLNELLVNFQKENSESRYLRWKELQSFKA